MLIHSKCNSLHLPTPDSQRDQMCPISLFYGPQNNLICDYKSYELQLLNFLPISFFKEMNFKHCSNLCHSALHPLFKTFYPKGLILPYKHPLVLHFISTSLSSILGHSFKSSTRAGMQQNMKSNVKN